MATKEESTLAERVYELLGGLGAVDSAGPVGPDTELASIGFDSLAAAELSATVEQELGVDVVECRLAGLRAASEVAELIERTAALDRHHRDAYPRGMGRLQRLGTFLLGWFCRWWFSIELVGAEHVPRSGPVVLCMNHESLLDIPLVVVVSPRPIRFMAKRELFAKPAAARFFHELGGFPVARGEFDLRAIEVGLEVLRRGEVLGMYPEGTRTPGTLLPFLPGAAWIALRAGAPLLPAAISGTHAAMPKGARFFKRVAVRIEFGPAIAVEREDDPARRRKRALQLTEALRGEIEAMWDASR